MAFGGLDPSMVLPAIAPARVAMVSFKTDLLNFFFASSGFSHTRDKVSETYTDGIRMAQFLGRSAAGFRQPIGFHSSLTHEHPCDRQ